MAIKKKPINFQRTKYYAYKKLGAGQKSKQKYKRATGRHNKTRQKWRSRPPMVEVGYKNALCLRGLVMGKTPILVYNLSDLAKVGKENVAIIGKIGNKNKIEIAREAQAKGITVTNLNIKKFLAKMDRKNKSKGEKKS